MSHVKRVKKQQKNIQVNSGKPVPSLLQCKPSDSRKNENSEDDETLSREIQFKVELAWCQDYIRREFESAKNDKRKDSLAKALSVLTNGKASMVHKRQVMSQICGDYRKAMYNEVSKTNSQACQGKMLNVSSSTAFKPQIISICIKKHQQSTNKSQESTSDFKFNFS